MPPDPEPTPESTPTPEPTPPAPTDPPAESYDWAKMRASLPTELRDSTVLNQFDGEGGGFEGMIKDRITLDALIGREKIPVLTKDSTPEEIDRFYNSLGRPDSHEGYDLGDFAPPENAPWDADLQSNMMQELHKAGLTNDQVNSVLRSFASQQGESYEATMQAAKLAGEESEKALRTELGDSYDEFTELGGRVFKEAFGEDLDIVADIMLPDGQKFGDHPLIVKAFGRLGQKMGEAKLLGPKTSAHVGLTPAEHQAEIDKMEHPGNETAAILAKKSHPEHKIVKAKWTAHYQGANPEP